MWEFSVHLCFVMHSSFAIISKRKRKLVALLLLSYRCIVTINDLWLFFTVLWVGLQCVIMVFPDQNHLPFAYIGYWSAIISWADPIFCSSQIVLPQQGSWYHLGLDATKPVLGGSDKAVLKPALQLQKLARKLSIYPSLVLVQPRKTRPCLTEWLLMGRKDSCQTNRQNNRKVKFRLWQVWICYFPISE